MTTKIAQQRVRRKNAFVTLIAIPAGGALVNLRRLLEILTSEYGADEDVRLLVADNSLAGSARAVFDDCCMGFGDRAHYIHEPRRGYSHVRNAIVSNAGDANAIAMIDDDETPEPEWLNNLRAARERSGADVVAGPVVPEFPARAPKWYADCGVFGVDTPQFSEGDEMPWCATNNTLMLTTVLERVPGGFDSKFHSAGGEDTHFFRRAQRNGCKIVWTHTAVVHEFLPPERLTRRSVFRRAIRVGNSRTIIEHEVVGGAKTRVTRGMKTAGLFTLGLGSTIGACLLRDRALGLRAVRRLGLAYGMALGFKSSDPWTP